MPDHGRPASLLQTVGTFLIRRVTRIKGQKSINQWFVDRLFAGLAGCCNPERAPLDCAENYQGGYKNKKRPSSTSVGLARRFL